MTVATCNKALAINVSENEIFVEVFQAKNTTVCT